MLHGIAAYRKEKGIYALLNRVAAIAAGAEICTANVPIGNIGVFVAGRVTGAFAHDVWSWVDYDGNRQTWAVDEESEYYSDSRWEYVPEEHREYGYVGDNAVSEVLQAHRETGSRYAEFWERDCQITYVWVKEQASEYVKKAASVIAKKYGCPVFTLGEEYDMAGMWLNESPAVDDTPTDIDRLETALCGY